MGWPVLKRASGCKLVCNILLLCRVWKWEHISWNVQGKESWIICIHNLFSICSVCKSDKNCIPCCSSTVILFFSCIGDISWFGTDYNWSMGNSKLLYTHYLYTLTLMHSVVIQDPVHSILSHHNSNQHLHDHNISPGHHCGCACDCCYCWMCASHEIWETIYLWFTS